MDDFERSFKIIGISAIVAWVVGALVSLGFLALIGWAIVMLVHHFAG